jgi:hypothetical protein
VGGRIRERAKDGTEHIWGTVTVERASSSWKPGWEALGDDAQRMFANYDTGWDYVVGERFGTAGS